MDPWSDTGTAVAATDNPDTYMNNLVEANRRRLERWASERGSLCGEEADLRALA